MQMAILALEYSRQYYAAGPFLSWAANKQRLSLPNDLHFYHCCGRIACPLCLLIIQMMKLFSTTLIKGCNHWVYSYNNTFCIIFNFSKGGKISWKRALLGNECKRISRVLQGNSKTRVEMLRVLYCYKIPTRAMAKPQIQLIYKLQISHQVTVLHFAYNQTVTNYMLLEDNGHSPVKKSNFYFENALCQSPPIY